MAFGPQLFTGPCASIVCFVIIGYLSNWVNGLVCFMIFAFVVITSFFSSSAQRVFKIRESRANDSRMKLISDMVAGVRTIKAYAWELHYLKKIN